MDIADLPDPMARIHATTAAMKLMAQQVNLMAAIRRGAILEAMADGHTLEEIAERAGITKTRVSRIISEGRS